MMKTPTSLRQPENRVAVISRTKSVRDQFASELEGIAEVDTYTTYDEAMAGLHGGVRLACLVMHVQGLPLHERPWGSSSIDFYRWANRCLPDTPRVYLRRKGLRSAVRPASELIRLPIPHGVVRHILQPYLPVMPESDAVTVDIKQQRAIYGGQSVRLTRIESHLLAYFQSRRGEIATPDELMIDVWGYEPVASDTLVRAHISNLRRKLAQIGIDAHDALQTIRAQGYRWIGIGQPQMAVAA